MRLVDENPLVNGLVLLGYICWGVALIRAYFFPPFDWIDSALWITGFIILFALLVVWARQGRKLKRSRKLDDRAAVSATT